MVIYALLVRLAGVSGQLHHHAGDPGRHAARPGGADGDPGKLVTATATLTLLVGAMLLLARLMRLASSPTSSPRRC